MGDRLRAAKQTRKVSRNRTRGGRVGTGESPQLAIPSQLEAHKEDLPACPQYGWLLRR